MNHYICNESTEKKQEEINIKEFLHLNILGQKLDKINSVLQSTDPSPQILKNWQWEKEGGGVIYFIDVLDPNPGIKKLPNMVWSCYILVMYFLKKN